MKNVLPVVLFLFAEVFIRDKYDDVLKISRSPPRPKSSNEKAKKIKNKSSISQKKSI